MSGGGIQWAGEFNRVRASQGADDGAGVSRAFADVGGDERMVLAIVDDEVGDLVVVGDEAIGGNVRYRSLVVEFGLEAVGSGGIEV